MSPLGPWTRGVRVRPVMGTYRVRKTYKLIRLTSTSLLKSTQKGMALPTVTVCVIG
jgi:hypothetical protein